MPAVPLTQVAVHLRPEDNVAAYAAIRARLDNAIKKLRWGRIAAGFVR